MDQVPLVREQIDAGADFLREFEALFPLRAAFWLKEDEDVQWYLFVASEDFASGRKNQGYTEASRIARGLNNPNFDRFRIKLIGADGPLAQSAMDIYRRYPGRIPTHAYNKDFGEGMVDGVYVYPLPAALPT